MANRDCKLNRCWYGHRSFGNPDIEYVLKHVADGCLPTSAMFSLPEWSADELKSQLIYTYHPHIDMRNIYYHIRAKKSNCDNNFALAILYHNIFHRYDNGKHLVCDRRIHDDLLRVLDTRDVALLSQIFINATNVVRAKILRIPQFIGASIDFYLMVTHNTHIGTLVHDMCDLFKLLAIQDGEMAIYCRGLSWGVFNALITLDRVNHCTNNGFNAKQSVQILSCFIKYAIICRDKFTIPCDFIDGSHLITCYLDILLKKSIKISKTPRTPYETHKLLKIGIFDGNDTSKTRILRLIIHLRAYHKSSRFAHLIELMICNAFTIYSRDLLSFRAISPPNLVAHIYRTIFGA